MFKFLNIELEITNSTNVTLAKPHITSVNLIFTSSCHSSLTIVVSVSFPFPSASPQQHLVFIFFSCHVILLSTSLLPLIPSCLLPSFYWFFSYFPFFTFSFLLIDVNFFSIFLPLCLIAPYFSTSVFCMFLLRVSLFYYFPHFLFYRSLCLICVHFFPISSLCFFISIRTFCCSLFTSIIHLLSFPSHHFLFSLIIQSRFLPFVCSFFFFSLPFHF